MALAEVKELIDQISLYEGEKSEKCPRPLVDELFAYFRDYYSILNKKHFETYGMIEKIENYPVSLQCLVYVGGEGIVLLCLSEKKMQVCLKIARTMAQNEARVPSKVEFWGMKKYKQQIPRNIMSERFRLGTLLQKELPNIIKEKKIKYIRVPEVFHMDTLPKVQQTPALHCVMEWIESPNILQWIQKKKNLTYSLNLFCVLLEGIDFLHKREILHRDLKPDNILMGDNDSLVLVDWTLSKDGIGDRGVTLPGTRGGTPGFAPAKFILDKDFADANALDDIYYLGMTFWCLITLRKLIPLRAEEYSEKVLLEYRHKLAGYLPEFAIPIFWQATEGNEEQRYQNAKEFQNAVMKLIKEVTRGKIKYEPSDKVFPDSLEVGKKIDWGSYARDENRDVIEKMFLLKEKWSTFYRI